MRDHIWLKRQLDHLLKTYFSDVSQTNPLEIKFGREAKYRFGSIRLLRRNGLRRFLKSSEPQKSIITITSMFAKVEVPVHVVQYTICHELCHYHHGFSSSNRRLFKFPHHGGIVNKELVDRGAGDLIHSFKKWLKIYRKQILSTRISI